MSLGRQRGALDRCVDTLVEVHPVVKRYSLRDQVRVERIGPGDVLAHGQRFERLIAVTDFDGRRTLARMLHARQVACATYGDRRILWQLAVQPVGGIHGRGVGR
jgi:hypothetical protein